MFGRRRQTEQFCQARFVGFARWALASRLDPLGVLYAQGVVYLLLELDVRGSDCLRATRKPVRFHTKICRRRSDERYFACVGFFSATHEVIHPPSFERPSTCSRTEAGLHFSVQRFRASTLLRKSTPCATAARVGAASASAFSITKS